VSDARQIAVRVRARHQLGDEKRHPVIVHGARPRVDGSRQLKVCSPPPTTHPPIVAGFCLSWL
jgi:acetylglutamate kinase